MPRPYNQTIDSGNFQADTENGVRFFCAKIQRTIGMLDMSLPSSKAYNELLKIGAFPGQIDPWAEARFFHAIHGGMIGHLMEQIQGPLEEIGYIAGRETSLTIADRGST